MAKKIITVALFFVFCALAGTGIGMQFHLVSHVDDIHFGLGALFMCLVGCHLFTERRWICTTLGNGKLAIPIIGMALGCAIFLFFLLFPPAEEHEHRRERLRLHHETQ